jgi:hypothetical protein
VKAYKEYMDSLERNILVVDGWQTNQRYNDKKRREIIVNNSISGGSK